MDNAVDVAVVYDEDFHLIPTSELELYHEDDGAFVRHVPTDVWWTELYKEGEDQLETMKRAISALTYQVFLHREQEKKIASFEDEGPTDDVMTNLIQRVEKIEHALRMR